jgi:ankyrin repeat protein
MSNGDRYLMAFLHYFQTNEIENLRAFVASGVSMDEFLYDSIFINGGLEFAALIEAGVDINTKLGRNEMTSLSIAVKHGNQNMVRQILGLCPDINAVDSNLCTALHYASMGRDSSIVQQLLTHNANIHMRNSDGDLAEDIAIQGMKHTMSMMLNIAMSKSRRTALAMGTHERSRMQSLIGRLPRELVERVAGDRRLEIEEFKNNRNRLNVRAWDASSVLPY